MGVLNIVSYVLIAAAIIQNLIRDYYVHLRIRGLLKRRLIFSPSRVMHEIKSIDKRMKKGKKPFDPHVILGIGGRDTDGTPYVGGGIVGLYLSSVKYIGKPALYLDYLRSTSEQDQSIVDAKNKKTFEPIIDEIVNMFPEEIVRILVVDDWSKSGRTITDVTKSLRSGLQGKASSRQFRIRIALIVRKENQENLGEEIDWETNYCCNVSNQEVNFPWHA